MRLELGKKQSSNTSEAVSLARIPSLFSFLATVKPLVPRSTMKAEIPCEPAARSVIASTTVVSANVALVIKFFEPLSTQPPARRTAVVRIELASDPELGSVRPHAAKLSPLASGARSEEHTSELQSHVNLVCRLLLEKKKNILNTSLTKKKKTKKKI